MIEAQPIKLIEDVKPNIPACNLEIHNERVATRAGVPFGEPIPHLTDHELREYGLVMHRNSGLPKPDARRTFKQVRQRFEEADEVEKTRLVSVIRNAIAGLREIGGSLNPTKPQTVYDAKALSEPISVTIK